MWLSWEQDTGCWQSLSSLSRPGPTFKAASWPSLVGGPRPAPLASSTSPGLVFMELIRWRKTFKVSHVHVISLIENYKYKRKFTLNRYLNINILFYLYFYKRNWELWIDENWSISNKRQSKKLLLNRGLRTPYVHKSLCFPLSPGHNMVIFQEYQIFNFFSSQFAQNFWTYFLEGKILKSYIKGLRMQCGIQFFWAGQAE